MTQSRISANSAMATASSFSVELKLNQNRSKAVFEGADLKNIKVRWWEHSIAPKLKGATFWVVSFDSASQKLTSQVRTKFETIDFQGQIKGQMTGNALTSKLNFLFSLSIALSSLPVPAQRLCGSRIPSAKKRRSVPKRLLRLSTCHATTNYILLICLYWMWILELQICCEVTGTEKYCSVRIQNLLILLKNFLDESPVSAKKYE